ncbi:MAG: hypothetical protein EP341_06265 [Sphingomonadales bacterium]|nr:MAG: hypothetical protein EP341_06265 [Sphingomonadales bacterium]
MILSLLASAAIAAASPSADASAMDPRQPDVIQFGSSAEDMQVTLSNYCETSMELRVFDPPEIPIAQESHQQIDCEGFDYLGAPRLAEFVFIDGKLQLVWILLTDQERETTIAAMREVYGSQGQENEQVVAFTENRTAWRNEPAEVLFYSEEVAPIIEQRLTGSQ